MNDRKKQINEDVAGLVVSAYQRADDRDEFAEIIGGYQYLRDEKLSAEMLFALCTSLWHGGYIQGIEETE